MELASLIDPTFDPRADGARTAASAAVDRAPDVFGVEALLIGGSPCRRDPGRPCSDPSGPAAGAPLPQASSSTRRSISAGAGREPPRDELRRLVPADHVISGPAQRQDWAAAVVDSLSSMNLPDPGERRSRLYQENAEWAFREGVR
jgi:hypothetical protein